MPIDASFNLGSIIISLIGLLVTLVGFLIVRGLRGIDETMKSFHKRLVSMENEVIEQRGFNRGYTAGKAAVSGCSALLIALLFSALAARAQTPTPATFNPLPVAGGSFATQLRTFLLEEDASRFAIGFNPFRIDNCTHGTAAGLVGTFSNVCHAIVAGHYIVEPATSLNYSAASPSSGDVCWTVLHKDTATAVAGWTRITGTHYLVKCTGSSSVRPTLPSNSMILMGVTISSSAITAVTIEPNEWPSMRTYTNTSEIDATRQGQFWQSTINSRICYTNGATCTNIPLSDASGCATCGDSATSFFAGGAIETTRGGTAQNSSAWSGVIVMPTPGTWNHEAALAPVRGGLGADFSGCTGVPDCTAGSCGCDNFPSWQRDLTAIQWTIDGAQCTRSTAATLVSGVLADSVKCADNSAGRIFLYQKLSSEYAAGGTLRVRLVGANIGTTSGDTGFDVSCMCNEIVTSGGSTLSAANFGSAQNLDFTWSGVAGQIQSLQATVTCGGSCVAEQLVTVKLAVDATATTHATPAEIMYPLARLLALTDNL